MQAYQMPNGKQYKNWREVFKDSQKMVFTAFNTGTIYGALKIYTQVESLPDDCDPNDAAFEYAVMAFHFRHPEKGDILIDAGFDRSFHDSPPFGNLPVSMKLFQTLNKIKYTQQENEDLAIHLDEYRIEPRHIFLTHMHADHSAGVPAVVPECSIYFGKKENSFYYHRLATGNYLKNRENVYLLDFEDGVSLAPFEKALDIFGDGSFWALSTPGHTKDHIAYLINCEDAPILITGDAELSTWGMENGVMMGSDYGEEGEADARRSAEMLREFKEAYPEAQVWFSHDVERL